MKSFTFKQFLAKEIKLLQEAKIDIKKSIRTLGPLKKNNLLDPISLFSDTYKKRDEIRDKNLHVDIDKEFKNDIAYQIWLNYVKAMFGSVKKNSYGKIKLYGYKDGDINRKYYKEARGFFGWLDSIRSGKIPKLLTKDTKYPILAFKNNNDYIFGHYVANVLIVCYISIESTFSLIKLLKTLCQYNNVVFMITLDIAEQLDKLGLFTDGEIHKMTWRDQLVDKKIFATSNSALQKALSFEKISNSIKNNEISFKDMRSAWKSIKSIYNSTKNLRFRDMIDMLKESEKHYNKVQKNI